MDQNITKVLGPLVADETIKKTAIFVLGAGNIGKYLIDRLKNSCDYYLFGYSTSKTLFINNGIDSEMKEYNIIDFCKIIETDPDIFNEVKGESESLGGLLLELNAGLPKSGDLLAHDKFAFEIISADKRRIKKIKVKINS